MYKGYSWSAMDVLNLLGIRYNPNKEENYIKCPFCGSNRFAYNLKKGAGWCFSCKKGTDSAGYYAVVTGMSLNDARDDIKRRLNIPDENGKRPERIVYKEPIQEEPAPIEVKDFTYRAFLDELTLSCKNEDHLLARGFSIDDIAAKGYKTFPSADNISFEDLCRRLLQKGCKLEGVPGFYKNDKDEWTFPKYTQGIIIPQINIHNQIEGFQIRKDDDLRREFNGELEGKCVWFSSKGKPHGAAAHTSVHIASDFIYNNEKGEYEPVLRSGLVTLTEGGMKADLCTCILEAGVTFIAVQGVNALNPLKATLESLKEYGLKTVTLAFDMDYLTNKNVQDAMQKVKSLITDMGLTLNDAMNWEYEKVDKNGNKFFLKGLDDYLAYEYKKIIPRAATK